MASKKKTIEQVAEKNVIEILNAIKDDVLEHADDNAERIKFQLEIAKDINRNFCKSDK